MEKVCKIVFMHFISNVKWVVHIKINNTTRHERKERNILCDHLRYGTIWCGEKEKRRRKKTLSKKFSSNKWITKPKWHMKKKVPNVITKCLSLTWKSFSALIHWTNAEMDRPICGNATIKCSTEGFSFSSLFICQQNWKFVCFFFFLKKKTVSLWPQKEMFSNVTSKLKFTIHTNTFEHTRTYTDTRTNSHNMWSKTHNSKSSSIEKKKFKTEQKIFFFRLSIVMSNEHGLFCLSFRFVSFRFDLQIIQTFKTIRENMTWKSMQYLNVLCSCGLAVGTNCFGFVFSSAGIWFKNIRNITHRR